VRVSQILKMHDIEALSLNGTLTADERNETIRRFNTVPEDRVLLFSTVGAVGLNLTVATIVVLFVSQRPCSGTDISD
jgi:SNF2 family DNA or RNA helicase